LVFCGWWIFFFFEVRWCKSLQTVVVDGRIAATAANQQRVVDGGKEGRREGGRGRKGGFGKGEV